MLRSRATALAARALRGSLLSEPHVPEAARSFATRKPLSAREVARARDVLARRREEREALHEPLPPPPAPAGVAQEFSGVALPWDEATLEPVFSGDALVVTREVEWGNVILGFEQANKYTVRDGATGNVVGYLAEETSSLGGAIARQLMGRRRPFTATLLSPAGDVILRVRRPLYLIESTTLLETAEGERVGEIHAKWHLWKRQYDAFLNGEQFGKVRSGLLAWEFVVEDAQGRQLCKVDRNFSGLGLELFTDAGAYALHFANGGSSPPERTPQLAGGGAAIGGGAPGDSVAVLPPPQPLQLSERAATLALAVAVDFDYFSRLSGGASTGGMMGMGVPLPIPMPFPGGGGGGSEAAAGSAEETSEPSGGAGEEAAAAEPVRDWRDKEDLGGDEPFRPDTETPTWGEEEDEDGGDDGGGDDDGGGGGGGMWGTLGSLTGIREE